MPRAKPFNPTKLRDELVAHPLASWHEDMGPVLWWKFPITEPPYCGTPLDLGKPMTVELVVDDETHSIVTKRPDGGWPGYHTHFTLITAPLIATDGVIVK